MDWLTLLPITAVVAIVVFAIKETLEHFRRRSADRRKLAGLISLLARECELNYATIKLLRHIVEKIPNDEHPDPQFSLSIGWKPSGRPYARVLSESRGMQWQLGIPQVHRELMSKFLLDVATLDKRLFELMEPAYDGLAEVEHVRESLLNFEEEVESMRPEDYLAGLADYASGELQGAEDALRKLYTYCTGKPLTRHRLR